MINENVLMTKEIFLGFDIERKIQYLNTKLDKGFTVTEIRTELGIGEKKLQKILKENGYKYNQKTKKYESSSTVVITKNTTAVPKKNEVDNKFLTKLMSEINEMKTMNTKVVEMYEWYEKQRRIVEKISLDIQAREDNSTTVKSYKVYCETDRNFQAFCKNHKHLKVQDLVSKALDEFIAKYK